ncbi:MAG: NusG domain II-containing protein [Candidatus Aminicenantes bacterium]|jgi:hypothetical protein
MMLAAPVLTPLFLSSKKTTDDLELLLITEEPQVFLPFLLQQIQDYSSSEGHTFTLLNPHPKESGLTKALTEKGWRLVQDPASAHLILSFSHLQNKALASFTLVRKGRIWDIRSRKVHSLWQEMNKNHAPSSSLTIASLKKQASNQLAGEFVSMYRDGQKIETLSLEGIEEKSFKTRGGRITVQIAGGKVWVPESSCRHKICLFSPPVSLAGERIICAPNHFFLEIERSTSIDTIIG